ncbi:MAG: CheR family methyltransferase [Pseudomonadota bacterium]|nr:CheR family methyltransferase [Pseudomonadota bacterium]
MNEIYWVGIGASAGGLDPLKELCSSLPLNANMVYIIAQHLSPRHTSLLTQLVQKATKLECETIEDGVKARPNVIYVTPPQNDVYIRGDVIHLAPAHDKAIPKPSVNSLFVSLAEEKKEHAVGVVLSGTGADGAQGIKMIRASGGLTLVQDDKTAAYDGMPSASLHTECVDLVLSPNEIGEHLAKLSTQLPEEMRHVLKKPQARDKFSELVKLVREQCGFPIGQYKKPTLQRRIERRMLANNITNFDEYVDFAKQSKEEVQLLYKDVLISVTNFFRDAKPFEQLADLIKTIVNQRNQHEPIRLWVAGCATGEEAYSIAILLCEAIGDLGQLVDSNVQIFATDVDTDALAIARKGIYSKVSVQDIPEEYVDKYLIDKGDTYEVKKELRSIVLFAPHNIIEDPPFLKIDLITCRNLLIYFEPELQKKVYNIFHYSLKTDGYLFLGKSESTTQVSELFATVAAKERIFKRRRLASKKLNQFILKSTGSTSDMLKMSPSNEPSKPPALPEMFVNSLGDAAVLIDDNLSIDHVYGDSEYFTKIPRGKPSLNLGEVIIEPFKQELRPLVYKALRTHKAAVGHVRKTRIDGQVFNASISVYPLSTSDHNEKYVLVAFNKLNPYVKGAEELEESESGHRVKELEDELALSREHLQTVVEELETANEELQSTNEELQSSNEELQSSNEELETTNEELQAANEELATMNDELNVKTNALEETSNHLSNIKNSLPFPLVYITANGKIIKSNTCAQEFFNIVDDTGGFYHLLPAAFSDTNISQEVKDVIELQNTKKIQLEKDGRFYWLHITPHRYKNNGTNAVILSFIENTELIHQKQEIIESQRIANEANIAKGEFLANVSHEIRTPLNAIYGVKEIFRRHVNNENKREKLLTIFENATDNLKGLLDDLLDFAKLEAKQVVLEFSSFSPKKCITGLVNIYATQTNEEDVKFGIRFDKDIPDTLLGDELRVKQIIGNLLSNAIKFTSKGRVDLDINGYREGQLYNLNISISDTGIGMDEKELSTIFNKFTQSDSSITRRYGGTGLGLSIVKELVDIMSGSIHVESEKGKGTTIDVKLPMTIPQRSDKVKRLKDKVPAASTESKDLSRRILIVEDNPSNVFVLTSYLDDWGYSYDVGMSGEEGLEFVRRNKYAVIFLDIQLDDMTGFDFFKRITSEQIDSKASVVAISAHVHKDIINKCKEVGMQEFIPKPFEVEQLEQVLDKYMVKDVESS